MEPADEHAAAPPRWPNVNVPPGYRFKPTPEELIQFYLDPWLQTPPGEPSPGEQYGTMCATDVYAVPPAELTAQLQQFGHDDDNWYFLSVARWKDGSRTRKQREVGPERAKVGVWHGSGKRIDVPGLGSRLTFEYRHGADRVKDVWLMEEFTTARTEEATSDAGVKVLCRLHLTPKAAAGEDGGDEGQQVQVQTNTKGKRRSAAASASAGERQQVQTKGRRRSAAAASAGERQVETGGARCGKRQRTVVLPQVQHGADADYWTAAPAPPDVGCSYYGAAASSSQQPAAPPPALPELGYSYYATTSSSSSQQSAAPAALPEIGYSYYATTSSSHLAAAPVSDVTLEELVADGWQQQPPMMEQGDVVVEGYDCAGGVHGRVYLQDVPPPLEMVPPGMEWMQPYSQPQQTECGMQYFSMQDFGLRSDCSTFLLPYPELPSDGVQENNDLKPAEPSDGVQGSNDQRPEPSDGVQENNDDLEPEAGDGVQENNDLNPVPGDGVQENNDLRPEPGDGVQGNDDPKSSTDTG